MQLINKTNFFSGILIMLSNLIKDTHAGYIAKDNTEQIYFVKKASTSFLSRVVQM